MDSDADTGSGTPQEEKALADVTKVPLVELLTSRDAALVESLRKLLADIETPDRFAGFGNVVAPDNG